MLTAQGPAKEEVLLATIETQALIQMEGSKNGLAWPAVHRPTATPSPTGSAAERELPSEEFWAPTQSWLRLSM